MYRSDLTMPKLECPYCGRNLKPPPEAGIVTCAGCEQQFEPGKVRTKPPSVGRAAIGWVLFVFGIVLLVPAVTAALRSNFHDRDLPIRLLGIFLIPAVLTFTGLALKRGRTAVRGTISSPRR
jgi:hypothetical protein